MSKNLGKYKQELKTRECLVQAIYQYISRIKLKLFNRSVLKRKYSKKLALTILKKTRKYFRTFRWFKVLLASKNKETENLEKIDEAIIWLGIVEIVPMNLIIPL